MLQSGTVLGGRYTLVEPVARGGMGEVWRADDPVLRRIVAVKTLLPNLSGRPDFAARFQAEALAMAALSDPAIVEIYDYGQSDGLAYLVMPFIEGESLRTRLRRTGRLAPTHAMALVAQAAGALQAAHDRGIVHRDVKPSNLMLRPNGRLVLTDFGIAQLIASDRLTDAGGAIGTAEYLSPEQVVGRPVSPATDVYALGIVAYEMLTRSRPFEADTPVAVALKHTREAPPPLPEEIPPAIRDVVMRALAKEPGQRWPSAADMARAATRAAATVADPPGAAAAGAAAPAGGSSAGGPGADGTPRRNAASAGGGAAERQPGPPTPDEPRPCSGTAPRAKRRRWPAPIAVAAALLLVAGAIAFTGMGGDDRGGRGAFGIGVLKMPGFGEAPASTGPPEAAAPTTAQIEPSPDSTRRGSTTTTSAPAPVPTATSTNPAPTTEPPAPTSAPPEEKPYVVPWVLGQTETTAKDMIVSAGLTPTVRYVVISDGDCRVLSQTPSGGTSVPAGSAVEIELPKPTGQCPILSEPTQ